MEKLKLTGPEAGIALAALVAFSDDNPTDEEGAVMRKYYLSKDAESLKTKLEAGGYAYPADLSALFPVIVDTLKKTSGDFQSRAAAVGYLVAQADGNIDQKEMKLLGKAAGALGMSLYEVENFASERLKEIDETTGYEDFKDTSEIRELELTLEEAGAALCILTGFADDDPSDAEAGVIREYFPTETVTSLLEKMDEAGLAYPQAISETKKSILSALSKVSREDQLRILAIAYKTAGADGRIDENETALIEEFCEEFVIGLAEVKEYFKAVPLV